MSTTNTNIPIATNIKIATSSVPLTGASYNFNTDGKDETLYVNPAGTIAAMTVVFPADESSRVGQILRVFSTQIVTALTVTSTSLTIKGTAVTALAVNTPVSYEKVDAAVWVRLV